MHLSFQRRKDTAGNFELLQQDYPNCEIVVSDNYSTDATREIVLAYADRRVRYSMPGAGPKWIAEMSSYTGVYVYANFVFSPKQGNFLYPYHVMSGHVPGLRGRDAFQREGRGSVVAGFYSIRLAHNLYRAQAPMRPYGRG